MEYAKWLGMDLEKDVDMFWIAREGLKARRRGVRPFGRARAPAPVPRTARAAPA